jgi:molecular chaperone DnaK
MIHTAEKQLEEHGTRVGDAERKAVEDAVSALREASSGQDTDRIRERMEALSQALGRFGEAIHRAAAAQSEQQGAAAGQASTGGDEDVVDAEFEEVDRRKHG